MAEELEGANQRREFVCVCEACGINTDGRHTEESAKELCEAHNSRCEEEGAYSVPVCWVCHDRATRRNQKPPYEYVCEEHAISIDAVPIEEVEV